MTIQCDNVRELAIVCAQLVKEGVMFEAHTHRLTITLTGGY